MTDQVTEQVIVSDDGPIRTIRMNRPDKKNALTAVMYDTMAEAIETAGGDSAIRCLMIAGVPGAFSAGNDLQDFMQAAIAIEYQRADLTLTGWCADPAIFSRGQAGLCGMWCDEP